MSQRAKETVTQLLSTAGISINGDAPWDIKVNNEKFYETVLGGGSLAMGETYMAGWWECERRDELYSRLLSTDLENTVKKSLRLQAGILLTKIINFQTPALAFDNVHAHYDMDNDLFKKMLDKRMVYSGAYWENATNINEAQEAKLDLACRKMKLEPGMHVLDIGCGWGSWAKFAAERYGVKVTGITLSEQQVKLGKELCAGLPVELKLMDYRDIDQKFDRIVSIGMFEHVGHKNNRTFFQAADRCLVDDGIFLLQTIGNPYTRTYHDRWMNKYILPNCTMPSLTQIAQTIEGIFLVEDLHNFGPDYDKTLMAWHQNFTSNWHLLKDKYDTVFYRMWTHYLLQCAGGFRAKRNFLWQIVLTKRSRPGKYYSER